MRDTVKLSTDVYLPAGAGPWPVVLIRTPYNNSNEANYAQQEVASGTAVVVQDMRGRYESEGLNVPFAGMGWGAQPDDLDTCSWITQQWWCNGKIGTTGGSMLGITQNLAAPLKPPGLVCQFIGVATASIFHQFVYQGGALREEQILGWIDTAHWSAQTLELIRQHPEYDDYWQAFNIAERISDSDTPALHYGGWFDTFVQGTIDSYMLRSTQGAPGSRDEQWLVIGPWTHAGMNKLECGEVTWPAGAAYAPGISYEMLMDHYLTGADTGLPSAPKVTYYLMGAVGETGGYGNYWKTADSWPVPAVEEKLYLHQDNSLSYAPPQAEPELSVPFDPADPSPTKGGRNLIIAAGMYDQREVEARQDIALFTSHELQYGMEVTGRVTCKLYVATDAPSADVAVRLCDIYPDGRSMLIADGLLRLSYREDGEHLTPVTPGEVYAVTVDLWSTAYVFNPGHRIRLSLAGGNWPRWERNPGTGEAWTSVAASRQQANTYYFSPQRQSYLSLPVVVAQP